MSIKISNSISLDGFICGPNGEESWISEADEKFFLAECEAADVIILGANTYSGNGGLFPVVPKDHYVFTSQPEKFEPAEHMNYTTQTPEAFVAEHAGKDILIAGGGHLNASFLKAGLVTDITACVHPIILGAGTRQFEGIDFTNMTELSRVSQQDIGDNVTLIHYQIK